MKKAKFYDYDANNNQVLCKLCPHFCKIKEGKRGICRTRLNYQGVLYTENYGKIASINIDPIEKKPFYHFKPKSKILSLGTYGCNFRCGYCQNYSISQEKVKTRYLDPDHIIELLDQFTDNIGIAFTYNEPFIWYEYLLDVSKKVKVKRPDKLIVLVTNGFINPEPLKDILPYIDAMNIDLKSFNNQTYQKLCFGKLNPVLKTIENSIKHTHIELTNLIVTNENDSEAEIEDLANYLGSLNPNIPLHLSRYYPNYELDNPPTPKETLLKARAIAKKYLNYVYIGNLPNIDNNTYCHNCGNLLIEREFYQTEVYLQSSSCPKCQEKIPIIL